MKNESTSTTYSGNPLPSCTLESLEAIFRNFTDRQSAPLVEVRVHPNWMDVFVGNLREEGFAKVKKIDTLLGVTIVTDSEVPYGKIRYVHVGDVL